MNRSTWIVGIGLNITDCRDGRNANWNGQSENTKLQGLKKELRWGKWLKGKTPEVFNQLRKIIKQKGNESHEKGRGVFVTRYRAPQRRSVFAVRLDRCSCRWCSEGSGELPLATLPLPHHHSCQWIVKWGERMTSTRSPLDTRVSLKATKRES